MDYRNYTLGRGKVSARLFLPNTTTPVGGFRYFGNTPEFNLSIEAEMLDHFSSDEGIREKDDSIPLQVNRTGSLVTDNINVQNLALFFFGSSSNLITLAASDVAETIENVQLGTAYRLGESDNNPTGYMGLDGSDFAILNGAVPLVAGVDYRLNADFGTVEFLETATAIDEGDDAAVTFTVKASTRERVISGSQPIEVSLLYEAKNPKGKNFNYFMPYVKISPNGDHVLKSDEWQTIPWTLDIQKMPGKEAIYIDGNPAFS